MFPSCFPKNGPTPCPCRALQTHDSVSSAHSHLWISAPGAVKLLTGGERSQRVHAALGKPELTPRLPLYESERGAAGAELLPSAIWGSSGQQGCTTADDSTCGPQQPQSLQDRVQRGAQEKNKGWEDGNCWEPGLELELLCIPTAVLQKSRLNQLC